LDCTPFLGNLATLTDSVVFVGTTRYNANEQWWAHWSLERHHYLRMKAAWRKTTHEISIKHLFCAEKGIFGPSTLSRINGKLQRWLKNQKYIFVLETNQNIRWNVEKHQRFPLTFMIARELSTNETAPGIW